MAFGSGLRIELNDKGTVSNFEVKPQPLPVIQSQDVIQAESAPRMAKTSTLSEA
jgi:hypothetical protein